MSGNEPSATATLATPASVAVVAAVITAAEEEEEEDPAALTLDCVESAADMDLVNGPNPWLPAYGFQLQHHSQFQPTHLEDLRANGSCVDVSHSLPVLSLHTLSLSFHAHLTTLVFGIPTRKIHRSIRFGHKIRRFTNA